MKLSGGSLRWRRSRPNAKTVSIRRDRSHWPDFQARQPPNSSSTYLFGRERPADHCQARLRAQTLGQQAGRQKKPRLSSLVRATHESLLTQIRLRRNKRPCRDEGVRNLEVDSAGAKRRVLPSRCPPPLERQHAALLQRRRRKEPRTRCADHFRPSGETPCPRLKNGRLNLLIQA